MKPLKNLLYTTAFLLGGVGAYQANSQEKAPTLEPEKDSFQKVDVDYNSSHAMAKTDFDGDGDDDFILGVYQGGWGILNLYKIENKGNGSLKREEKPFASIDGDYKTDCSIIPSKIDNNNSEDLLISLNGKGTGTLYSYAFTNDGKGNYTLSK